MDAVMLWTRQEEQYAVMARAGELFHMLWAHQLHDHVIGGLQDLDERLRCGAHASQDHAKSNPAHAGKG